MARHINLAYPFTGRWLVQNSPANRVPSHGTHLLATTYAIDFVPVADHGRTAPFRLTSLLRPEAAARFPGFGRPVLAPAAGTVALIHNDEPDHPAYRGVPSIGYALTQHRRAEKGWKALTGNFVMIETGGLFVVLCHLRQDSIKVAVGQHVHVGDVLAECGNSGNSTEPHLHLQAIDNRDVEQARAVAISFNGNLPVNGEIVAV